MEYSPGLESSQGSGIKPKASPPTLASAERAISILLAFKADGPELTAKEIMARTGLRKATAFRFLSVLTRSGLLVHEAGTGLYSPGLALLSLASMAHRRKWLTLAALPTMRRIRDEINETIYLSVLANDHRFDIEQVEARTDIVRPNKLGVAKPLYATSPSRLLLALSDDDFIHDYLRITPLVPYSEYTITTPERLWDSIRSIREKGYAESENELNFGGVSVSAPIYGHFGEVVAAVTATTSRYQYTPEIRARAVKYIVEAGAEISERIRLGRNPQAPAKRRAKAGRCDA